MHLLNPLSLLLFIITPVLSNLTFTIPPSQLLPNPHSLPADTHATLTSASLAKPLKAPLTRSATFVFPGIASSEYKIAQRDDFSGSYLLDIRSSEYVFTPLRVDLDERGYVKGVWETFRGNEWGNRGVEKYLRPADVQVDGGQGDAGDVVVDLKVVGRKGFYEVRQTCMCFLTRQSPPFKCYLLSRRRCSNSLSGLMLTFSGSLAAVTNQEPHDFACACCAGFYLWDAKAYGKQYVWSFLSAFALSLVVFCLLFYDVGC